MFDLITLAFPGFFRPRTYEMGTYYGIRVEGKLAAMAGERVCMPDTARSAVSARIQRILAEATRGR
jgi:hypothetical protein